MSAAVTPAIPLWARTLYRAYVEPSNPELWRHPERTVFIEAYSAREAEEKIRRIISVIDGCAPDDVSFYNVYSARELIEQNDSADIELRLFECGWCGGDVIAWNTTPMFCVRDPRPLTEAFAKVPTMEPSCAA